MNRYVMFLYLFQMLFASCDQDIESIIFDKNEDVVISSSQHLAFPDLIWYHDFWYITFRLSDAHVNGTYSKIKVLKSSDFITWEESSNFEYPDFDLRDPKFSLNTETDSLYLHCHGASTIGVYGQTRKNLYINYTDEIYGVNKKIVSFRELPLLKEFKYDWLWRPIWNEGKLYVGGYRHDQFRLYQYNNINDTPVILKSLNEGIGETTLRIKNDRIYFLSRKKAAGILGNSLISSFDFQWESLFTQELGGPNFIIRNDTLFLGGRLNSTTSIFSYPMNKESYELNLIFEFPSKYPDCGYPGLYLKDNIIYGVYYTVSLKDEGFQIKTFKL